MELFSLHLRCSTGFWIRLWCFLECFCEITAIFQNNFDSRGAEYLKYSFLRKYLMTWKPWTIFVNSFIVDVWHCSEYASEWLLQLFYNIFKIRRSIFCEFYILHVRWSLDKQTGAKLYFLTSDVIQPAADMLWEMFFSLLEKQSSKKHNKRPKRLIFFEIR